MPLTSLQKKRLEQICKKHDLDTQIIDDNLTFEENMGTLGHLAPRNTHVMNRQIEQLETQIVDKLVEDLKSIIEIERKAIKEAKFQVGNRIFDDKDFLTRRYGDEYFGGLARKLNLVGYSASQLYACVAFAKHPKHDVWLNDDKTHWTEIYHQLLPKRLRIIVETPCDEAMEVIGNMRPLLQRLALIHAGKTWKECNVCSFKVLCKFVQQQEHVTI